MLRAVIVEDQKVQAQKIKDWLLLWSGSAVPVNVVLFEDGDAFLARFRELGEIDVVFLDIELGGTNGMNVAKRLRENGYSNTIVFTTRYADYAIKGYEVNAFRYYVKPVKERDIRESMDFVLNKSAGETLQFKYHGVVSRIPWKNIIFIESFAHNIYIYTIGENEPAEARMSLLAIMRQSPDYIIRCQRSFVINVNHIKKRTGNRLLMLNDKMIVISPSKSKAVKNAMEKNEW